MTQVLANPAYIPTCRWRKERVESCNSYCCVKTCNNLSFSQTTTYSSMINPRTSHRVRNQTHSNPYTPVQEPLLCMQSQRKHCITCSRRLWLGYDRPCPQPHVIQMPIYTLTLREILLRMTVYVHRWLHVYIIYGTCTCMCNMLQVPGVCSRGDSPSQTPPLVSAVAETLSLTDTSLGVCSRGDSLSLTDTSLGVRSRGDSPLQTPP